MPSAMASGGHIHAVTRGAGSDHLVFVHGAGGNRLLWGRQVAALAHGHRVTALDLPGHGRSRPPGRTSIGDYAADIEGFLDGVVPPAVVLIGHSMGGAIALTVALDRPDLVRGLVLVSTGARLRVSPALLDGLAADFNATIQWAGTVVCGPALHDRVLLACVDAMRESGQATVLGDFRACDAFDVRNRLAEIRVPVLVICGSEDQTTPPKYSANLADQITGARLELIRGAGHMAMLQQPQAVSRAVTGFLATL